MMQSGNVRLLAHSTDHLRALREDSEVYQTQFGMRITEGGVKEFLGGPEVSESFLARLRDSSTADLWRDGFGVIHAAENRTLELQWPARCRGRGGDFLRHRARVYGSRIGYGSGAVADRARRCER